MPSLRKDPKTNNWFVDFYTSDIAEDGRPIRRRVRISLKTKNYQVARIRAAARLREADALQRNQAPPLKDFFDEYTAFCEPRRSRLTLREYRRSFEDFISVMRVKSFSQITARTADMFIAHIARKLSAASVNKHLRQLKAIFNQAVRWQYITANPFAGVKRLEHHLDPPRVLSASELSRIFSAAESLCPDLHPLFLFYLCTGLRRLEALRLSWDDVDFDKNLLWVRGKQKKTRLVPLFPRAKQILLERRNLAQPFSFDETRVTKAFKACARAAGVADAQLHDLRRTFSTRLEESGFSLDLIQKWLGHSTQAVTRAHYVGDSEDFIRRITSFEEGLFNPN
jgi:integrase